MMATAAISVGCGDGANSTAPSPVLTAPARPTHTPTATATPTATPTPEPTATPVPPTPTPAPRLAPPGPVPRAQPAATGGGAVYVYVDECGESFPALVAAQLGLVSQYGWNVCSALRIIDCESDGNWTIYNGSGSGACGLWQHLPCQHNGDGPASTALAWQKYSGRGWQPWTVGGCFP